MKPKVMLACLGLLAFAVPVWAQQKVKEKPREEVVIKKSGSGKEKTVIVIEGDRVTVNGKPLAEYGGDDVIIHKRALERLADGQVEYRREMELAQREMQRAQREMQRSVLEMGRSRAPLYRYSYPNDFRFEFDFDGAEVKSEPRAFLGVGLEDADKGVKITNVTEGSAADKAGLKEGDVITKFGGTSVKTAEALTEQVRAKKPNDEVELAYIKGGEKKERKVKVKLGESKSLVRVYSSSGQTPRSPRPPRAPFPPMAPMAPMAPLEEIEMIGAPDAPAMPRAFSSTEGFSWSYNGRQLGLRVQETDDSVGVKVLDVAEGSLAATAGVKENDIVTSIDGKTIKSTRDCADAMRDARDKNNYMIRLLRGGSPMTLEVKIPKKLKKADF
jgi:serine protease Do